MLCAQCFCLQLHIENYHSNEMTQKRDVEKRSSGTSGYAGEKVLNVARKKTTALRNRSSEVLFPPIPFLILQKNRNIMFSQTRRSASSFRCED